MNENKKAEINTDKCINCGACSYACPFGAVMDKSYMVEVINIIKNRGENYKTCAIVAPAIAAQFDGVTLGQVTTAIHKLGFDYVVEAAVAADMVAESETEELIEKYDMADKMVFNSFDAHALEYIAETYPGKYLLHGFYPYNKMHNVKRNPDEYLYCACIWGEPRNREYYEYLAAKGIEAWIGASITGAGLLGDCFKLGARLVTTNYPGDCKEKLEKIGAR